MASVTSTLNVEDLLEAASMILISELGDKTFFVACIMSTRASPLYVGLSAYTALIVMTIVSTLIGISAAQALPHDVVKWTAISLFVLCGIKYFWDAYYMKKSIEEEVGEEIDNDNRESSDPIVGKKNIYDDPQYCNNQHITSSIEHDDKSIDHNSTSPIPKPNPRTMDLYTEVNSSNAEDAGVTFEPDAADSQKPSIVQKIFYFGEKERRICWITFLMTLASEWGDRSQIATISLAATKGFLSVVVGALIGHFVTTIIAVTGGGIFAKFISERAILVIGGLLFIGFAIFDAVFAD
ncbi:hypothetical protein AAMO2058_000451900 [Amorphochlora amoebiformis]